MEIPQPFGQICSSVCLPSCENAFVKTNQLLQLFFTHLVLSLCTAKNLALFMCSTWIGEDNNNIFPNQISLLKAVKSSKYFS